MRILIAAALLAASITAPARAAEPAKLEGDAFEVLSIALELGANCKDFRGFEYHYLGETWDLHRKDSAAQADYAAARKKALDSGADTLNAALAGDAALKRHAAAYRDKAAKLGCAGGGVAYADLGRIEAYKQVGGLMTLVNAYRGGQMAASPLPPMTPDEGGLLQAFHKVAQQMFGARMAEFEAMMPGMAQQRFERYPKDPDLRIARFIKDQSAAFALLHHETLATMAGWTVRGATLPDGTPFGLRTVRVSKDGAPDLALIATPKAVTIHSPAWGKGISGYIALGRRADGTVIAGLAGDAMAGAPTDVVVKAEVKGTVTRTVTGTRVTDGCPYARCFAFTAAQAASLAPGASTQPVLFYAAPSAGAPPNGTGTDGQSLPADGLRALLQSR